MYIVIIKKRVKGKRYSIQFQHEIPTIQSTVMHRQCVSWCFNQIENILFHIFLLLSLYLFFISLNFIYIIALFLSFYCLILFCCFSLIVVYWVLCFSICCFAIVVAVVLVVFFFCLFVWRKSGKLIYKVTSTGMNLLVQFHSPDFERERDIKSFWQNSLLFSLLDLRNQVLEI